MSQPIGSMGLAKLSNYKFTIKINHSYAGQVALHPIGSQKKNDLKNHINQIQAWIPKREVTVTEKNTAPLKKEDLPKTWI